MPGSPCWVGISFWVVSLSQAHLNFISLYPSTIKTSQQAINVEFVHCCGTQNTLRKHQMGNFCPENPNSYTLMTCFPLVLSTPPTQDSTSAPSLLPGCAAARVCSLPQHSVYRKWTCSPLWLAAIQSGGWSVQTLCRVHDDKNNHNNSNADSYTSFTECLLWG